MPVLSHLAFHLEVRDVADFISKLPHYSSLESLLFSTTTATDHGLVLLPNDMGLKFSRLRNLTIVGDRRLVHFPISSHPFPSLCHLSVYGLDIDSVSWLISPTLALPNLETLSLSNFWHMDRLVSDSVFPSLKTLVIRPTSTDIRSWLHLVGGGGGGNGLDHPLRKLDLFIHSISRISRIENLEFGGVSNLAPFRHLSSLKSLTFVGDIALMGGFSVLDKMRGLEKLVLLNARIHTLRPLTNLTRLSHVFISHAHIPVESIHPSSLILANLLPNLLYLRLDSCHLDGFTLSMLSGSPRLEELEIVDSEFQSIPDHNSGHTTGEFPLIFTNLKKLDLSGSGLTSLLEWLPIPTSRSKHNLKKLEQLILLDNALMDGFEFIQSSFLPRLKRLEIGVSNGAFLDWEDWASLAHALEILHVRGTSPEHDDDEQGGNDMQSSIGITKVHMINEGILSSFSKLVELRLVAMDLQLSSQWIASIFKSSPLLEVLDLSHNPNLQGPLDQVLDAGHLEELRLANTGALVGDLVVLESSLSTLHTLDLSHNHHMRGFDQLFGCFGRGGSSIKSSDKEPRKHSLLKHLSLANTNLNIEQASLGSSLFNLPHLESLDLSSNGELGSHMVLNLLSLWTIREIDLCGTYLSPYITPFSEREEGEAFVLMKRDARQILQIIFSRYMNQQQQHAASYLAFKG